MSKIIETGDGGMLIDSHGAMLVDLVVVAKLDDAPDDQNVSAVEFQGRINGTDDRDAWLILMDVAQLDVLIGLLVAQALEAEPEIGGKLLQTVIDKVREWKR